MTNIDTDLNATIANAVNARIEAEVIKALSGDEVLGRYVAAALAEPVARDTYGRNKPTRLQTAITDAISNATKAAIIAVVEEDMPRLKDEVRKCFRRDADKLAQSVADGLAGSLAKGYGVSITMKLPWERDY
jgi:2-phospho-L-lactate guanylyltransferase (CobY/MobA/RfbA family)